MKTIKCIIPYFIISMIVLMAVITLIWLDHKTTEWSQIFGHNILVGILLYGLPMMLVVSLFYSKIQNYLSTNMRSMGGILFTIAIMVVIYLMLF